MFRQTCLYLSIACKIKYSLASSLFSMDKPQQKCLVYILELEYYKIQSSVSQPFMFAEPLLSILDI